MDDKLVVVFVSGGLVQDTRSPEGIQVEVVDYDNLESGKCPICRGAIKTEGGYPYCPACDINWDEIIYDEIAARLQGKEQP